MIVPFKDVKKFIYKSLLSNRSVLTNRIS